MIRNQVKKDKQVAIWLMAGVIMIVIQVLLGGITRLTGSGLSITEWKPILGTLPPMNDKAWQDAFDQYKQIGQYKHINFDYTISDFRFIYFWEWFHRVWARLIGIVFLIPFIYFLIKKKISRDMIIPMIILFLLGLLQAVIGWIMVKSGLNDEDVSVDHIRLAIHFISALILLCYTFWFALRFMVPPDQRFFSARLKSSLIWLIAILTLQLIYGAFMAGLKAGSSAPTWPEINGMWWPAGMSQYSGFKNLTDNPIMVQFIHRLFAYLFFVLMIIWYFRTSIAGTSTWFNKTRIIPVALVFMQVVLGIFTVINAADQKSLLWWGVAHQFTAMLLLLSLTWLTYLVNPGRKY